MSSTPRISVIMPVRNGAPWLAEALDSIVAQSCSEWELVTIDDASEDESRNVLDSYARRDDRIRVLDSATHRLGVAAATNKLLASVRAPLVARMDADDISHPDRLLLQLSVLEADPGLAGLSSRVQALEDGVASAGMQRYLDWQNGLTTEDDIRRNRFVESPMAAPSMAYRREALSERLGGWREVGWPEDWDLFLRAFELGLRFARLPETLLAWRLHPAQATRVHPSYSDESFLAARAHFLARYLARVTPLKIWILGAGPLGKRLGKALATEHLEVAGYVDVDPKKVGGIVRYRGRRWPVIAMDEFLSIDPRPFAISAVGQPGARDRIRSWLGGEGWVEESDFVAAA